MSPCLCSSSTKDRALTACQSMSEQLTLSECTFQSLVGTCFPVICSHCSSSAPWNTQNKSSLSFHRIQGSRAFSSPGETLSGPLTVPKGHGFPHPTNPPFINVPVEMNVHRFLGWVWPEVIVQAPLMGSPTRLPPLSKPSRPHLRPSFSLLLSPSTEMGNLP